MTDEDLVKHFQNITNQFENVNNQFQKVDKQFENVNNQFQKVDKQFENVTNLIDASMSVNAKEFEAIHEEFTGVHKEIANVNGKVDENTLRLDSIDRKLSAEVTWRDNADKRITRVEKHLDLPPLQS